MKYWIFILSIIVLSACSNSETNLKTESVTVAGDFLFAGPNTLQGAYTLNLSELANQAGVEADAIKAVYISGATISFNPEESQKNVESVLVQWVSDELPLVSVATKSPLPESGSVNLEANATVDILGYLNDATSTLVVDVNLTNDADELKADVSFDLKIEY